MIVIENTTPRLDRNITIQAPKDLGATASVWIHEAARRLPEYNYEVDCWQVGRDGDGDEIKIDRLGRFLFGVPGYDGHLRFSTSGREVTIYYPSLPVESEDLMNRIKIEIEKGGVNE